MSYDVTEDRDKIVISRDHMKAGLEHTSPHAYKYRRGIGLIWCVLLYTIT